jgi:hypothetical protein
MSIKKFITDSYRSPVFAAFLVFILPMIYSLIINKDWNTLFYSIPTTIWVILILLFIIWIITIAIRKKMNYYSLYIGYAPTFGWQSIGEISYEGVIWKIRTPNQYLNFPDRFEEEEIDIDVEIPPRCPNCKTKLEKSDKIYWYTWQCVRCNFKKRTWNNFSKIQERVEKVAERDIETLREQMHDEN